MKKQIMFTTILLAIVLAFTSCNKNRTCTCIVGEETYMSEMVYVSKEKAENYCAHQESQYQERDGQASCTLD